VVADVFSERVERPRYGLVLVVDLQVLSQLVKDIECMDCREVPDSMFRLRDCSKMEGSKKPRPRQTRFLEPEESKNFFLALNLTAALPGFFLSWCAIIVLLLSALTPQHAASVAPRDAS
jgi:hypothetical protein